MAYSLETSSVKTIVPGAEVSGFCDVVARQKISALSGEVPQLSAGEGIDISTVNGKTVITNNISAGENISLVYDMETNTYRIDGQGGEGHTYTGVAPIQVNNITDEISITGESLSAGPGIDMFSSGGYVVVSSTGKELSAGPGIDLFESGGYFVISGTGGGGGGAIYTGISPIDVNNTTHQISAKGVSFGVQNPLFFVQDDNEAVIIGCSAGGGTTYTGDAQGALDEVYANSGVWLTAHQDLSNYYTTAEANTLSSMLSGAIDYVSANAGGSSESDVFVATYGTTTFGELYQAYTDGKIIYCKGGNDLNDTGVLAYRKPFAMAMINPAFYGTIHTEGNNFVNVLIEANNSSPSTSDGSTNWYTTTDSFTTNSFVQNNYQQKLNFGYSNSAITSINTSAIGGGTSLPDKFYVDNSGQAYKISGESTRVTGEFNEYSYEAQFYSAAVPLNVPYKIDGNEGHTTNVNVYDNYYDLIESITVTGNESFTVTSDWASISFVSPSDNRNGVLIAGEETYTPYLTGVSLSSLNDAGVNNIVYTASLPAEPDANTLYLIPEA